MHSGLTLNGLLWGLEPQANILPVPKATLAWDLLGRLLEPAKTRAYTSSHKVFDKSTFRKMKCLLKETAASPLPYSSSERAHI